MVGTIIMQLMRYSWIACMTATRIEAGLNQDRALLHQRRQNHRRARVAERSAREHARRTRPLPLRQHDLSGRDARCAACRRSALGLPVVPPE